MTKKLFNSNVILYCLCISETTNCRLVTISWIWNVEIVK